MVNVDFDIRQKVSKLIAFTFIILLSLTLGWYSIKASEELLVNAPNSKVLNISARTEDKNIQDDKGVRDLLEDDEISSGENAGE